MGRQTPRVVAAANDTAGSVIGSFSNRETRRSAEKLVSYLNFAECQAGVLLLEYSLKCRTSGTTSLPPAAARWRARKEG
jgi:hypothetical protein